MYKLDFIRMSEHFRQQENFFRPRLFCSTRSLNDC